MHKRQESAGPGDNIGMNIKGLDKQNMPRSGDVMVYKKDTSLGACDNFDAQIQVLDIPGEIKIGYSPIGFVRCGRSACRIAKMNWKIGKETGGKKWRTRTRSSRTRWLRSTSHRSSHLLWTPSRTARVSPALRSWTAMALSCLERSSRRRTRSKARRRSETRVQKTHTQWSFLAFVVQPCRRPCSLQILVLRFLIRTCTDFLGFLPPGMHARSAGCASCAAFVDPTRFSFCHAS